MEALPPPPIFAIGEVLNDTYEVLELLGAGGMGQVFEANDRSLNRRVAIKAGWPHMSPSSLRKEAQALAAVRHPGLVTVHWVGVHRGIDYLVMERIYGVRLADHLKQRTTDGLRFSIAETIEVLSGIADGLAAVHRAGLAHRDVTPMNTMLSPGNRIVLMDFGVSLPEFDVASAASISGTPHYMAPEAVRNRVASGAGHLVDIYAIGVIGFEMLTGSVPFDGRSIVEVLTKQLTAKVPRVATLRPDVPERLAALLHEMLAKDPGDRPQSAESVGWQLRSIALRQEPRPRSERLSVLVVDDEADVVQWITAVVKATAPDADVQGVTDPETALHLVRRRMPHLLFLDLEMRPLNGIEIAMYLRGTRDADRCTIALVSARARPEDVQLLQVLGVHHFLTKTAGLAERIGDVLREHRQVA